MSTGPSNSPFMGFCKNYAVDGVSDLGARAEIAEGRPQNLMAAVEAGMGDGNVPEIFD